MTPGRFQPVYAKLTPEQQQIVIDHRGFAQSQTRTYVRKYRGLLEEQDVNQWVETGMSESARAWNSGTGVPFPYFAARRIFGLVMDAAKLEVRQRDVRRAATACLDMQLTEGEIGDTADVIQGRANTVASRMMTAVVIGLVNEDSIVSALEGEEGIAERQMRGKARAALDACWPMLSERRRKVLELYYFEGRELKDVALALNMGYSTIRREHNEALDLLGNLLRARGVTGF